MTGGSLGLRTGSYGSLQQGQNGVLQTQNSFILRKSSRMSLFGSREKERFLPLIYRYFGRRKVGMLILAVFALLAFLTGFITVHKACPVCYLPVDQALARMPSSPSASPVLQHLNYFREENPIKAEPHGGSDFGGFPSLKQRNDSFNIKESMTVHCGFAEGCRPGSQYCRYLLQK